MYAINTHHSRELRIVVAIRNKLLLITRKHNKPGGVASTSLLCPLPESPVEEFQYIRVGLLFTSPLWAPVGMSTGCCMETNLTRNFILKKKQTIKWIEGGEDNEWWWEDCSRKDVQKPSPKGISALPLSRDPVRYGSRC